MSFASSAVTYTSVYTDFEPGRVFWGADEELSDGGSSRVIVYGYDGFPMRPDGLVDYPMDGGDDGDDDDGDLSGDDADDEDEDEKDEGDGEHLAPADSAIVIPTVELVSPPEGTEPVLQAAISLPPEAEVDRLLAMPTPPLSPLTLLSPPSVRELLARCTTPSACPSPPPIPSPLLPSFGCPNQIQTLRMASTQELINAVTAALPLPPLPPPLYIPPLVDLPEIAPMTVGKVNTRVTELTELHEHDAHDLYALLEDAQDSKTHISQRVTMDSQRVDLLMEDRTTSMCLNIHTFFLIKQA
nr:hypothetical protein [Tanacetum cinerariifolium]